MKTCFVFVIAVMVSLFGVPLHAQVTVQTSEEGIDLVRSAIFSARAREAEMNPAVSNSERLIRMADIEQAPRLVLSDLDLSALSEMEKQTMWGGIWELITPIDQANQSQLLEMVPEEGWFSISSYGREAAGSAFLIVQHSNPALWRRFLPAIEAMVLADEADGSTYALMYDRLALSEGRPQRYGSQMQCSAGQYAVMEPVENMEQIDALRSSVGLGSLSENLERFADIGC